MPSPQLLVPLLAGLALSAALAVAQEGRESPPNTYELVINGESFLVEANRIVTLQSQQQPGVAYEVALRVAATQQQRLNHFQFSYDLPTRLYDDHGRSQRTARLTHELGFTMLLGDLGGRFDAADRQQALDILVESATEAFKEMKVEGLEIGKPHERKFGEIPAHGVVIRYKDSQDFGHTSLLYVLAGETFTATCVVQFLDHDSEEVLPLVRKILESVRPL